MDIEEIENINNIIKAHKKRRSLLMLQQAREGYSTDASVVSEIQEISVEIELNQRKIDNFNNKGNNNRDINASNRYTIKVDKLLDLWEAHLIALKENPGIDNKTRSIIRKIQQHINWLDDRKSFLGIMQSENVSAEDLYTYASDLLFNICKIQTDINMAILMDKMLSNEIEDTLIEARYYMEVSLRKGFEKGSLFFRLAAVCYELNDRSPEIIYKYCVQAIENKCPYPEVANILFDVCGILSAYPNDYREEAKDWLLEYKKSLNLQEKVSKKKGKYRKTPLFCPNSSQL